MSERPPKTPQDRTAETNPGHDADNKKTFGEKIADAKILETPTPLDIALQPGSEEQSPWAQEAYNDMETNLKQEVDVINANYARDQPRDQHISPSGPGMDALNLMARLSEAAIHDRKPDTEKDKSPFYPKYDTQHDPSVDMARKIITAYPHPGDLLVAINEELEAVDQTHSRHVNSDIPDTSLIQGAAYRLILTLYGDRANAFFKQARAEVEDQADTDRQNAQPGSPEPGTTEATTVERQSEYRNREILGSSGTLRLEIRGVATRTLNAAQEHVAQTRNAVATPRLMWRTWRRDVAQRKYDRKASKVGTGNFITNKFYAKSAAKAQNKLSRKESLYSSHKEKMDNRTKKADTSSAERIKSFHERVKYYSEKKIAAEQKKQLRKLKSRRKREASDSGMKRIGLERHDYIHTLTTEDKQRIRKLAVNAAKLDAMRKGKYLPEDDNGNNH